MLSTTSPAGGAGPARQQLAGNPAQKGGSSPRRNGDTEAVGSVPGDPRGPGSRIRGEEGPAATPETGSTGSGAGIVERGAGTELSACKSQLREVAVPLRPVLAGAKRPKKAHLFPALKNPVPMATERAGRAGRGGVARAHWGRGGGAGEGGLLQGGLSRSWVARWLLQPPPRQCPARGPAPPRAAPLAKHASLHVCFGLGVN